MKKLLEFRIGDFSQEI